MNLDPNIFKAYDVRGVYPGEVNEEAARAIGAAFVAYLHATRIAVGRDMRLSSPAIAAAFIDGATSQGADVVDYGMIATDMLYFAVARDGHDGGVEITASHNPKQYNGMKLVRQEAFPLSGDAGISDIRDMIAGNRIPAAAGDQGTRDHGERARRLRRSRDVVHRSVGHPPVQRRARRRQRHGRARRAETLRAAGAAARLPVLRHRRPLSQSRSQPAHRREPTRHRRSGDRRAGRTSASRGTATPTAVSSSTARARSSAAISSRRCSPKRSC